MNNSFIPYINPCLSVLKKNTKVKAVSINGKVKKLQCDKILFETILSSIDGQTSLSDLVSLHSKTYSVASMEHFLKTLIQAEVLLDKHTAEKSISLNIEPQDSIASLVIGQGKIYTAIQDITAQISLLPFKNALFWETAQEENIAYNQLVQIFLGKLRENKPALVIACPDKANQKWLTALNAACLELRIPLLFAYCNGQDLVIGPTVIPWKTPCYACLLQHRLNFMATNSSLQLDWEEMLELGEAWPLPAGELVQGTVAWAASLIVAEAAKILQGTICPTYIKHQVKIPLSGQYEITEITFTTLTSCPVCAGMNKKKLVIGRPAHLSPPAHVKLNLKRSKTKHHDGGLRNRTTLEAKNILNKAMSEFGLTIKIKPAYSGPLDAVLPTFSSQVDEFYHKNFPFIIPKKNHWGKGMSKEQAFLSGGFELFERISAEYHGDTEIIRASYLEVKDIAIDVKAQIGDVYCSYGLDLFTVDAKIDWVWGYSLTQEKPLLVPAFMVYLNSSPFKGKFYAPMSGGLSAGCTIEEAILQGMYEAIEHDSWISYQANSITPLSVDLQSITDEETKNIIRKIKKIGYKIEIKYLKNDLDIPVFKTWILNEKEYVNFAFYGLGANLSPIIALNRSITEAKLGGTPNSTTQKRHNFFPQKNNSFLLKNKTSIFNLYHFLKTDIWGKSESISFKNICNNSSNNVLDDINKLINILNKKIHNSDITVVNLTDKYIKIPVVRVLPAGLQKMAEPIQCANERIFNFQQRMGFSSSNIEYEELYNGRFPH